MLIDKILINGKLGNRIKEVCIKKYQYDEWKNINTFAELYNFETLKWSQKVWNYMFNITEIPKCVCGQEVNFRGRINEIYSTYCSEKCSAINVSDKRQKTLEENNIKKWGVKNVFQLETTKNKSKHTLLERYGVEHQMYLDLVKDKIKNTTKEKYGVECILTLPRVRQNMKLKADDNWDNKEWVDWFKSILIKNNGGIGFASQKIREKYTSFCINKWGVTNSFAAEEIKQKIKEYYINKYGVENPQQVEEIHNKTVKSSFYSKKYKDTELYYQGTYELDFLNKYHDKTKIIRGKTIKYNINEISKIYYPDFYLPEYDLTVEIKSSYFWQKCLDKNLAKYNHMIDNNIKYIVIINKDYTDLELLIN